ncbi:MOSC domain-containing protein [Arthrobacter glacialis]|uniref:MOSC domain-containing protein n=1 Tax=Arthrobacter glacialis TaxID=1664 RepID=A0A2S3ZYN0_ARTGL|nr:MOSC domain-containing protein [Arthrobacter glacialis]POH74214.1 MOSC domain-containing protein [Arthrobacter glacialis]
MTNLAPPPGSLLAICRVHQLITIAAGAGVTAIDKRAVHGPVKLRTFGVFGDVQADTEHHGGPDQAVYAYSQEDADYWSAELGRDIPPGLFGENLRTQGVETTGAVIGTRWRIGKALLEVTSPRVPCATFGERMDEPQWVKRFTAASRVGTYLRVLERGTVQTGDTITVEHVPSHGITVGKFFSDPSLEDVNTLQKLHHAGELTLNAHYWSRFERILQKNT